MVKTGQSYHVDCFLQCPSLEILSMHCGGGVSTGERSLTAQRLGTLMGLLILEGQRGQHEDTQL